MAATPGREEMGSPQRRSAREEVGLSYIVWKAMLSRISVATTPGRRRGSSPLPISPGGGGPFVRRVESGCFPEFRWRRPQGGGGGRRLCRSAREEVGLSYAVWKAGAFRNFGGDDPREEEGVVAFADQPGRRWAFRTSCGKQMLSGKKVRRRQGGGEAPSLLPWALREEVQNRTRNLICRKPPRGRFR